LIILNIGKGIFLTSKAFFETTKLFEPTTLNEVAGCLEYRGKAKTLEEMENAIRERSEFLCSEKAMIKKVVSIKNMNDKNLSSDALKYWLSRLSEERVTKVEYRRMKN